MYICNMIKKKYTKKSVDSEKYVNIETGESLSSEVPYLIRNQTALDSGKVEIKSKAFFITDKAAKINIKKVLEPWELTKVNEMIDIATGELNLLVDEYKNPFQRNDLMKYLGYKSARFNTLIASLTNKGIIYWIVGFINGRKVKWIMLNPTLARTRNTFDEKAVRHFQDLASPDYVRHMMIKLKDEETKKKQK